jgi:hypothetical protein
MFGGFSIVLEDQHPTVSGMAYCPLTSSLRPADMPLTMPLTLSHQEGFRATKSKGQVTSFTHPKMAGFPPEQRVSA